VPALAGLGFTAIAPGLHLMAVGEANAAARPAGTAASPAIRWGLLIDATKCAPGCTKCIDACHEENGVSEQLPDPRQNSQWIRKIELVDRRNGRVTTLPMMCQHCAKPPCVDVCPTGASMKRADGIVLVDRHTCIGCRYCMMACPYKARSFVHTNLTKQNPGSPARQGLRRILHALRASGGQGPATRLRREMPGRRHDFWRPQRSGERNFQAHRCREHDPGPQRPQARPWRSLPGNLTWPH
jgi:Fe-S-cluster-containing hydrogenase component 2